MRYAVPKGIFLKDQLHCVLYSRYLKGLQQQILQSETKKRETKLNIILRGVIQLVINPDGRSLLFQDMDFVKYNDQILSKLNTLKSRPSISATNIKGMVEYNPTKTLHLSNSGNKLWKKSC